MAGHSACSGFICHTPSESQKCIQHPENGGIRGWHTKRLSKTGLDSIHFHYDLCMLLRRFVPSYDTVKFRLQSW